VRAGGRLHLFFAVRTYRRPRPIGADRRAGGGKGRREGGREEEKEERRVESRKGRREGGVVGGGIGLVP